MDNEGIIKVWEEAVDKFYSETKAPKDQIETVSDRQSWLRKFQAARHPDKKSTLIYQTVSRHIERIQFAINVLSKGVDLATKTFPAAAPASFVTNAFVWLFESFAAVSSKFDEIEGFFGELGNHYETFCGLSGIFQVKQLALLRRRVVDLFCCSLEICSIAMKLPGHRFKLMIRTTIAGPDDLSEALSRFTKMRQHILNVIQTSTLVTVTETNQLVLASKQQTGRAEWNEILNWLSPKDFSTTYRALIKRISDQPDAGSWLMNQEHFRSWRDGDSDRLWYFGKPGAGKSVLATSIIRHLQVFLKRTKSANPPAIGFLYLCFREKPELSMLLGSLARQIISSYEDLASLPRDVQDTISHKRKGGQFAQSGQWGGLCESELEDMLTAFAQQRQLYLIVDALDEFPGPGRKELMKSLGKIGGSIKIMVTSRLIEGRSDLSQGFDTHTIEANAADIDSYIDSIIKYKGLLQRHEAKIKSVLHRKSNGIFLLTRLHMDVLEEAENPAQIHRILEKLPSNPDETYGEAIERIGKKPTGKRNFAINIMAWVSHAFRPLYMEELQLAVALVMAGDDGAGSLEENKFMADELAAYCYGLVVADENQVVQFVHYSVHDYVQTHKEDIFGHFHIVASYACARFFCITTDPGLNFAEYAGRFLHIHYKNIRGYPLDLGCKRGGQLPHITHEMVISLVRDILEDIGRRFSYCRHLDNESYNIWDLNFLQDIDLNFLQDIDLNFIQDIVKTCDKPRPPRLHVAAYLGCSVLVERFISDNSTIINELDDFGQTALIIALKRKFDDIAAILLENGATVDLSTMGGHMILRRMAEWGLSAAIERLIANAVSGRQTEEPQVIRTLRILLFSPMLIVLYIIDIFLGKPDLVSLPLRMAKGLQAQKRPEPTQRRTDVEVEANVRFYGEILWLAYEGDSETLQESVRALDKAWPDDWTSYVIGAARMQDFLRTACFLAVERGHIRAVEVLLDNGVGVNDPCDMRQTLLHRTVARNNAALVQLLLDKGANIEKINYSGKTAMMANADMEHGEVLEILLQRDPEGIHKIELGGYHEIYHAAGEGRTSAVEFFLSKGVDASIYNSRGWTPLHIAVLMGHEACVRLLLEKGKAKPSPITDLGMTPLDFILTSRVGVLQKKIPDMARRMENIEALLRNAGGMTANELYAASENEMAAGSC